MLHSKKMKANFFLAFLYFLVKLQFSPGKYFAVIYILSVQKESLKYEDKHRNFNVFFRSEFQLTAIKDGTEQGKDKNSFPNWKSKSSF